MNIVVVILVILLIAGVPNWHGYGYWPSGGVGLILLIVVILMLAGRL